MNEWEQTKFTIHEWAWMTFTVHKREQTLLEYTYFQNLMRNDWDWIRKYHSCPLMTDLTCSHLQFMNGQQQEYLKQSCVANLWFDIILSHSFSSEWQFSILLKPGWHIFTTQ
jgi:hypothetical protein